MGSGHLEITHLETEHLEIPHLGSGHLEIPHLETEHLEIPHLEVGYQYTDTVYWKIPPNDQPEIPKNVDFWPGPKNA